MANDAIIYPALFLSVSNMSYSKKLENMRDDKMSILFNFQSVWFMCNKNISPSTDLATELKIDCNEFGSKYKYISIISAISINRVFSKGM